MEVLALVCEQGLGRSRLGHPQKLRDPSQGPWPRQAAFSLAKGMG